MITINFLVALGAALIPLVIGFIWYHPKVFGTAWIKVSGVATDEVSGATMAKIFILTFVLSYLLALFMSTLSIHQFGLQSLLMGDKGTMTEEAKTLFNDVMAKYGSAFRTFKHGALHGTIAAIFFAMPVLTINSMFERKGFRYVAINTGYWIVTLALVGGVMCAFN